MSLKYYAKEEAAVSQVAPEISKIILTDHEAEIILRKLCRHFRVSIPDLKFWGTRAFGNYWPSGHLIKVNHNPKLTYLIHELGHHIINSWSQYRVRSYHNKKQLRIVLRMVKYSQKLNYWGKAEVH